jgi:hypothetical protein
MILTGLSQLFWSVPTLAGNPSAAAGQAAKVHPARFSASLEGFMGPSYKVEMATDGSVIYLHNPKGFTSAKGVKRTVVKVRPQEWVTFCKSLEEAGCFAWKKDYIRADVLDGTSWTLDFSWAGRNIASRGRNAYPNKKQFDAFTAATVKLLGGKDFK